MPDATVLKPVKNILVEITETDPETVVVKEGYAEIEYGSSSKYSLVIVEKDVELEPEVSGKYPLEVKFTNHVELSIVESEPEVVVVKIQDERVEDFIFPFFPYSGGSTGVDLSNYYTKFEIDQFLSNIYTKSDIQVLLSLYYTKSEINEKLENLIVDCGTY